MNLGFLAFARVLQEGRIAVGCSASTTATRPLQAASARAAWATDLTRLTTGPVLVRVLKERKKEREKKRKQDKAALLKCEFSGSAP